VSYIDLEFDTTVSGHAPLGDLASSLVSVDELLRDLATIAAYPSGAEFRQIEVAAIATGDPLKVKLSLLAIPEEAVNAFQSICREIIGAKRPAAIDAALERCAGDGDHARITQQERERIHRHVAALQSAQVRLKRIAVRAE
jgi:hypothetical protein